MKTCSRPRVNLSISLPRDLRDALRAAAFAEDRSVSSFIAHRLQRELSAEPKALPRSSSREEAPRA